MKHLSFLTFVFIYLLVSGTVNKGSAQTLYGTPPNEIFVCNRYFKFVGSSPDKEIVGVEISVFDKYIDSVLIASKGTNPYNAYIGLAFENLDEKAIDSIINRISNIDYIVDVGFYKCPIKGLPYGVRRLKKLYDIEFGLCDSLVTLNDFNSLNSSINISFKSCKIKHLPKGIENLKPMINLQLVFTGDFDGFDLNSELSKFSRRNNLTHLLVQYPMLDNFPDTLFKLTTLQTLIFYCNEKLKLPHRFHELHNLMSFVYSAESQSDSNIGFSEYLKKNCDISYLLTDGFINTSYLYELYINNKDRLKSFKYFYKFGDRNLYDIRINISADNLSRFIKGFQTRMADSSHVVIIDEKQIMLSLNNAKISVHSIRGNPKGTPVMLKLIHNNRGVISLEQELNNTAEIIDFTSLVSGYYSLYLISGNKSICIDIERE